MDGPEPGRSQLSFVVVCCRLLSSSHDNFIITHFGDLVSYPRLSLCLGHTTFSNSSAEPRSD